MDEAEDEQIELKNGGFATEETLVRWEHSKCGDRQCAARTIRHLQGSSTHVMTRDYVKLAAAFDEKVLQPKKWTRHTHVNCICQSEPEAALVAHELNKRGYKTEVSLGLTGDIQTMETQWAVIVSKPPAPKPRMRR